MKIIEVELYNYKSFGTKNNILKVNDTVTTVIGKNESGKSNLLDALKLVNLLSGTDQKQMIKNRHTTVGDIYVKVVANFTPLDFDGNAKGITRFYIHHDGLSTYEGALSEYIANNREFQSSISTIKNLVNHIPPMSSSEQVKYNRIVLSLSQAHEQHPYNYTSSLNSLKTWSQIITDAEEKAEVLDAIDYLHDLIRSVVRTTPLFYCYEESRLQDSYLCNDEFFKDIPSEFLAFLNITQISKELMQSACTNVDIGARKDAQDKINLLIKENFEEPFNALYPQEQLKLSSLVNNNYFTLLVNTSGANLKLSERSSGLQWFLNFYIDMVNRNLTNRPIVFLIDEPGVHLHVTAQKKLLELFMALTEHQHQLIYTTHSPYMLDTNNMTSIRALMKEEGITQIYNNLYHLEYAKDNDNTARLETITPLLDMLGVRLSDNIAFAHDKINVIVEGPSDFLYLNAMQDYLKTYDFYFIPSTGATNIHNLCSILKGWGFKVKALFDYDSMGNSQAKTLSKKLDMKVSEDYCFVNCMDEYHKGCDMTIESLIAVEDYEGLKLIYNNAPSDEKVLTAKAFMDALKRSQLKLSKTTVDNFSKLFSALLR